MKPAERQAQKSDVPPATQSRRRPNWDHSKPKGEGNRSILCHRCNVMVSMARDRSEVPRAAADDLEKWANGA